MNVQNPSLSDSPIRTVRFSSLASLNIRSNTLCLWHLVRHTLIKDPFETLWLWSHQFWAAFALDFQQWGILDICCGGRWLGGKTVDFYQVGICGHVHIFHVDKDRFSWSLSRHFKCLGVIDSLRPEGQLHQLKSFVPWYRLDKVNPTTPFDSPNPGDYASTCLFPFA